MENFGLHAFCRNVVPKRVYSVGKRPRVNNIVHVFMHPELQQFAMLFSDGMVVNFHQNREHIEPMYVESLARYSPFRDDFNRDAVSAPEAIFSMHKKRLDWRRAPYHWVPFHADEKLKCVGSIEFMLSRSTLELFFWSEVTNNIRVSWWGANLDDPCLPEPKHGWWQDDPAWNACLGYLWEKRNEELELDSRVAEGDHITLDPVTFSRAIQWQTHPTSGAALESNWIQLGRHE